MEEKADDLPRSFYIVSVASLLFQLARHTTLPIFSLYVLENGASLLQLGLILSIQSILMVVVKIPFTMVAERIGKNRMFIIAFVIQTRARTVFTSLFAL